MRSAGAAPWRRLREPAALLLATAAVLAAARGAFPAAAEKPAAPSVTISVARDLPDVPAYVGEPLALRITLSNHTPGPLMVPDWEHFAEEIELRVKVTDYPGENGEPEEASGFWEGGVFAKADFRALPPGDTVVVRSVVPMLPGKARVTAALHSPTDAYVALTDGKTLRFENGWTGHIYTSLMLDVPDEMSPEMRKRYDALGDQLKDPLVPAEQKGQLLEILAGEKHCFAARFLRQMCETLPAGAMRDAATWQLLKLAKVGTAYESIPLLLGWMLDAKTDQAIRVAVMEWAAKSLARKGRLPIADQASYTWPDALQKQARDGLQALTKDRNPYLAAKARELIR
jgi:hypothetical protein